MALKYPFEDQDQTPGTVRFSPCDMKGDLTGGEQIELYLPPSINFSDGANYEGFELGIGGAVAMDTANSTEASVSSEIEKLSKGMNVGDAIIAKMTTGIPLAPDQIVQGSLRVATNPNTRVLFKSVALRTFQFSFKMIPTSFAESQQIERIVKSFRTQMYPELAGGEGAVSIGYVYPDMYKIEMFLGGIEIEPRIKASFLTTVSTNFNPSSGTLMAQRGNNVGWSEVDLSLTFGEGVTLNKQDIKDGF